MIGKQPQQNIGQPSLGGLSLFADTRETWTISQQLGF